MSEAEYLAIERTAETRSEYHDGQMFAMAGGTEAHSAIGGNLFAEFRQALRGKTCGPRNSDLRVRIAKARSYVYPDVTVVCGGSAQRAGSKDIVDNPYLVAEVHSPSSERFDRGRKFDKYRTVESLREYLVISPTEPLVELFSRQPDDRWLLSVARGLDASIRIESLECEIPLAGIYENVAFPDPLTEDAAPPAL